MLGKKEEEEDKCFGNVNSYQLRTPILYLSIFVKYMNLLRYKIDIIMLIL
jgi:hypothetical protein